MKKMKVVIHKDGTQTIEVLGAESDECLAFTVELERRLGAIEGERTLKREAENEARAEAESEREGDS